MKSIFSPSRIGTIAGVLTLGVLLAGCKQVGQQVQEKATQAQTALLLESELSGITDPLVRKHFVAQANARSYRVVTTSSGRGEGTTTTELMVNGAEVRFHTLTQSDGKTTQEFIVIGDTTYVKDPSGTWWKQVGKKETSEDETSFQAPDVGDIKEEFTKKQTNTEFKQLGTEACGSLTCYKYQETTSGVDKSVRTFWFDNKDFLLRKDENSYGEFTATNTYAYEGINIVEPSPTKDVPEGKSAFEYMMGAPSDSSQKMPSSDELDAMMEKAEKQMADLDKEE